MFFTQPEAFYLLFFYIELQTQRLTSVWKKALTQKDIFEYTLSKENSRK